MQVDFYIVPKNPFSSFELRIADVAINRHQVKMAALPPIDANFCVAKGARQPMNTNYLIRTCGLVTHLCLYCIVNKSILHSVVSFYLKVDTIVVDALCVNQTLSASTYTTYKQNDITGGTLLNKLFAILRDNGNYFVTLEAIPNLQTLAFYRKHNFNESSSLNSSGFIPMNRILTPLPTPSPTPQSTPQSTPPSPLSPSLFTDDDWADLDRTLIAKINLPHKGQPNKVQIELKRRITRPSKYNAYEDIEYIYHPDRVVHLPSDQKVQYFQGHTPLNRSYRRNRTSSNVTRIRNIKTGRMMTKRKSKTIRHKGQAPYP
jgi:hypothetical protein